MAKAAKGETFEICCFTKQGSARLAKTYRLLGYAPVSEREDAEKEMHCVTYEESKK